MKKFRLVSAMLAVALAFVGCKEDSEPTYTVWADTMPYSEWSATYGGGVTLPDNTYAWNEISNSEFNQNRPMLSDTLKHEYTEEQLYNWFLGRSFGEALSKQLTAWLLTIDHGVIALRRGSQVHALMK